jgi:3',5'-cyclic AMP phosphodiesterase CpdA
MGTEARSPQRIIHISDLHIAETPRSAEILRQLPSALSTYLRTSAGPAVASVFITGDIFDSSDYDRTTAMARFADLYGSLMAALPRPVPVIVLPGNHDRRKAGVIGGHDPTLFLALVDAAKAVQQAPVFVAGGHRIRAEIVPLANHGTTAYVSTYDSTVLWKGLFSAGGELRQDDLLWLLSSLNRARDLEAPLILLTHHHLIPTPLTDVGRVDVQGRGSLSRLMIHKVLPLLVSNSDHEELTMTALGAGSALSTLHGVRRPVVVLHGHKHYPAARLLIGAAPGENDVLILAAGSAGVAEPWSLTDGRDTGHLWPSFNVIDLAPDDSLTARTVAFSPFDGRLAPARELVDVRRRGLRWEPGPDATEPAVTPELASNRADFVLEDAGTRWHLRGRRVLTALGSAPVSYVEEVQGAPGASATDIVDGERRTSDAVPFHLSVSTARSESSYFVQNGLCKNADAAERAYGKGTAFEWVGLVNRVPSCEAVLRLTGLPEGADVFASLTDMTTGREHVVPVASEGGGHTVACRPCAARCMLRLYFVL